jgi:Terminase large subunit, T4likevirus-type, N-terminal
VIAVKDRPIIWEPTERQKEFLSAPEREVLYGGSLGGGKSDALLTFGLSGVNSPKHRAIYFRRSFPQLRSAIERSHELFRPTGGVYNVQTSTWSWKSGAKVEFAFLDSDSDKWRYAGRSFNCILWDELCEWPNDSAYVYLLSRLRTTKDSGLRLSVRASANPLGSGASWVRARWKIPPDGSASECVDDETKFHRRFIPARLADNVHLLGSDYERQLQALPSAQRRALLEGRWDAVAGAIFEEFSHAKHVVEPFPVPVSWEVFRSCDPGFRAPTAVLWCAWDRDMTDTVYIIREIFQAGLTPEILSEKIRAIDFSIPIDLGWETIANDEPLSGVIDSAAFSNSGMGSVGDELNKRGGNWKPADKGQNSRLGGISAIHERLATRSDGTVGLKFFKNCTATIAEIPSLVYDPNGGEDIDQNCASDHCFDCLRYLLTYKKPWTRVVKVHWAHG